MTRNTLIRGTLILTLASFVTRILGVAQRVPLQRILGDQGMATYGIAYNIYGILLIVATVGIPSALSKQIAEYQTLEKYHEAKQTYEASRNFALLTGVFAALFLYIISPYYAVHISNDPEATLSIRAIAPALLLFPVISIMRGYFQGLQSMSPTGISQVVEQILRVGVALIFPLALFQAGYSSEVAIAGASFGAAAGGVGALAVMLYFFSKTERSRSRQVRKQKSWATLSRKEIYTNLLKIAIPISLASTAIPLIYFIDSSTTISLLKSHMSPIDAKNMLGILTGRAQSLAAIPPILAIALSSAVLPAVASSFAKKDMVEVKRTGSLALRLTLLTGAPLAFYLTTGAVAVNGFLFSDTAGSGVIAALSFSSIFQIMMMTAMAILQGLGRANLPMWYVFAGVATKAILNLIFAPLFGIYGIILATTCCFIVILALHIRAITRICPLQIMGNRWKGFLMASSGMLVAVWAVFGALNAVLPAHWPHFVVYGIICAVMAVVGFPVYALLLLWGKGMNENDIAYLPGPVRKIYARRKIG
jgi:stage V sporulation protein B